MDKGQDEGEERARETDRQTDRHKQEAEDEDARDKTHRQTGKSEEDSTCVCITNQEQNRDDGDWAHETRAPSPRSSPHSPQMHRLGVCITQSKSRELVDRRHMRLP